MLLHHTSRRVDVTVDELIELLSEWPGYYPVRLSSTAPVAGLEVHSRESGPYVEVI